MYVSTNMKKIIILLLILLVFLTACDDEGWTIVDVNESNTITGKAVSEIKNDNIGKECKSYIFEGNTTSEVINDVITQLFKINKDRKDCKIYDFKNETLAIVNSLIEEQQSSMYDQTTTVKKANVEFNRNKILVESRYKKGMVYITCDDWNNKTFCTIREGNVVKTIWIPYTKYYEEELIVKVLKEITSI